MSDLYAKAVTRVSLAKAVSEVDTGANATNTFPPTAPRRIPKNKKKRVRGIGRGRGGWVGGCRFRFVDAEVGGCSHVVC